jgi:cytochrome P450
MPDAVMTLPPLAAGAVDVSFAEEGLSTLVALFGRHGDAFRVPSPALGRELYVLSHPDHVRRLLVDNTANYRKGVGIERVAILLGNGIMTSEPPLWHAQRRLIQPAFHRTEVAGRVPHMIAANLRLGARWGAAADRGETIDLTQHMSEVTLEVVLRSLFGTALERVCDSGGGSPFALLTRETGRNLQFAYAFRQLAKLVQAEIDRRRVEAAPHDDILQSLLDARDRRSGEPMPDRQLVDEILTLIVAGHETTASALNWFWYLLASHADADARLQAEVAAAPLVDPAHADPERYPFVRQVLDETLRLYPPGWLLTRRALADDTLGEFDVPAGSEILLSPYLIHRHPRHWSDPERFDPDRFAPEAIAARSRFAYLPFGLGPRACIGESFALTEMLVHAVMLAGEFRLALAPGQRVELEPQVNLRPRHPLLMAPSRRASA